MEIEFHGHRFDPSDEGFWVALDQLTEQNSGCPQCRGLNSENCHLCRGR